MNRQEAVETGLFRRLLKRAINHVPKTPDMAIATKTHAETSSERYSTTQLIAMQAHIISIAINLAFQGILAFPSRY